MNIQKIQDFSLKDIVLISSLPDMGKVGGIVSDHLTKDLKTKPAAKIILRDKPWVTQKEGLVKLPQDEYTLSVDEENSVVVFTGENQPQESGAVFDMTETVLSTVSKMGNIKMVISTGGYLPGEQKNQSGVYGVATNQEKLDLLKSYDVTPLGSDVNSITWFNGVILGLAKEQNIDGVGLFGEILDADTPQYKSASNIIRVIEKILNVKIDTKEIDEKVIEIPAEIKKEGPGIG